MAFLNTIAKMSESVREVRRLSHEVGEDTRGAWEERCHTAGGGVPLGSAGIDT